MIFYNKIEDVYHTCMRVYTHLVGLNRDVSIKELILLDLLFCFPQYIINISGKRKFSHLKNVNIYHKFNGTIRVHKYLIEKSIYGAIRILIAKNIIYLKNDVLVINDLNLILPIIKTDKHFNLIYEIVKIDGISELNNILNLFEDKYEKIS